ncbi:MAG: hypothetical protein KatS3mg105_0818 [Gemmatales bacterium]|nr:MAG: hypothetical protein KatS3mg105_0818 [Gemmatales bacterium]
MSNDDHDRWLLCHLPLVARVVVAVFLISVGIGYFSALVQLHFQHAKAGEVLPSPEDAVHAYHGVDGMSVLERLIVADETLPFNGAGSMRAAFTTRSAGWRRYVRNKAKALNLDPSDPDGWRQAEAALRKEREWEIDAIRAWIHAGASKDTYSEFPLPKEIYGQFPESFSSDFFFKNDKDEWVGSIINIIDTRCVRCHSEGKGGAAAEIHLDKFEVLKEDYLIPASSGGMPLRKLAQSSHVHLLGFSMLYGLTGLVFAFTSYPLLLRLILAPFTLIVQIIDISCWWLARLPEPTGPLFGKTIALTGMLVGASLGGQILLTLFDMFGKKGKMVLVGLLVLAALIFGILYVTVIGPHLEWERTAAGL